MSNAAQQIHSNLGVDDAAFTKQLKGNQSWGELVIMEDQIRRRIADASTFTYQLNTLVHAEGVADIEFAETVNGIMRDLQVFADRLNVQISKRNGRVNPVNGPDEYTEYISVGLELTSLLESMQIVVAPTLLELVEYQHRANEKIAAREAAAKAEADAVNPAVVSDVEVKEDFVDVMKDPESNAVIVETAPVDNSTDSAASAE